LIAHKTEAYHRVDFGCPRIKVQKVTIISKMLSERSVGFGYLET